MPYPVAWTVDQIRVSYEKQTFPLHTSLLFSGKTVKNNILTSRQTDFFTANWVVYHPFLAVAWRIQGSDFTYARGGKTNPIPGKKSDADREDTDEVERWVQQVLLHNPVGVGGWVASDTQGSKSQGEEEVRQDATNDDQHVDPRLQDKKHRGSERWLTGLCSCAVETCLGGR